MKNFTISVCFGYMLMCILAMLISDYIAINMRFSREITIVLYVVLYFIFISFISILESLLYRAIFLFKNFAFAKLILFLELVFDIECNIKKWEIISCIQSKENVDKIKDYFNDKNYTVSYFALTVYAYLLEKEIVLNWFKEKYLNINLQIPTQYESIYRYVVEDTANN